MNIPMQHGLQQIKLSVSFRKEGKQVIAYSPALDISTVGKDEIEAKGRFEELVSIFFDDLIERDVFVDVLSELGWQRREVTVDNRQHQSWNPPEISQKEVSISVPVPVS